ncbi:hypothetical protein ACHAQA_004997 [Verticillium albo-atrum]
MSWHPFGGPSRSGDEWFSVGLASDFPDLGFDEDNLLENRFCGPDLKPGCKVFHAPREPGSKRTELPIVEEGSDGAPLDEDLKDQVLVFRHRGKFHAVDHRCPHSSYPLSRGTPFDIEDFGVMLSAGITCPKHAWSFDLHTGMSDRARYKLGVWETQVRDVKRSWTLTSSTETGNPSEDPEKEVWPGTTLLRLSSGNGPITRSILTTPLRDALPAEIPVIDISGAFSDSLATRKTVARQIRSAAMASGFFYISHHGIDPSVTETAKSACLDFFRQDLDAKMNAWVGKSRYFNGYKPPGSQRINKSESIDVRETFSWTYDPRYDTTGVPDVDAIDPEAKAFLRMEDFHWEGTTSVPHFKPSIISYWRSCLALARVLVHSFALSLDLPEDYFDAKFAYPDAALALNYYPSLPAEQPSPETTTAGPSEVSIGSHTDFQLFTMLWQDDAGGLQVLNRDGQWIKAAPIPGTFVVNIADYMQRITNDLYVSTVHRAVNRSGRERISMPFFFGFGLHESCAVVGSCVKDGEQPKYEEIGCDAWVKRRARAMHKTDSDDEGAS